MTHGIDTRTSPAIAPGETPSRRPDIQGLRAIAVGLVVAFHAGLPVPGGFVGVDVFFVISGFVITAMLMREQSSRHRIQLGRFYARRFLRLLPALALIVTVVAGASFLLQNPFGAQQTTASTGLGAVLLSANLVISHASGDYFADIATTNPLLNTWSLSVEEQFYLVFPALLVVGWLLARRSRIRPVMIVAALALASFIIDVATTFSSSADSLSWFGGPQSFAYYSPATRAWEFAVGALLALCLPRLTRMPAWATTLIGIVGVVLIAVAAVIINDGTPFPGVAALLPVAGTLLLLLIGSQSASLISRGLATRPLVVVGDVSYSWYLWHWPVIVFVALLWPDRPLVLVLAALGSLLPATLSYRFVEQPLRHLRPARNWQRILVPIGTLVPPVVACLVLLTGANSGWGLADAAAAIASAPSDVGTSNAPTEHPAVTPDAAGDDEPMGGGLRSQHAVVQAGCVNAPLTTALCTFGPSGAPSVLLAGDSQAYAVADGLIAADAALGLSTQVTSHTGCPFLGLPSSGSHDIPCASWQKDVLQFALKTRPKAVVIANRSTGYVHPELHWRTIGRPDGSRAGTVAEATDLYAKALTSVVSTLSRAGIPVVVINAVPDMTGYVDRTSLAAQAFGAGDYRKDRAVLARQRGPAITVEQTLSSQTTEVALVDPFPELCDDTSCWARKDGQPWYQDATHVSRTGSLRLKAPLMAALNSLVGDQAHAQTSASG